MIEKSCKKEDKFILLLPTLEEKLAKVRELYMKDCKYGENYEYISEGSDKSDYEP